MKDFRIRVQIRNNRLIEMREQLGMSPRKLSEASGVGYGTILDYESLKVSPISKVKSEAWTPSALKLSSYFGVSPGELWPSAVLALKVRVAEKRVDAHELAMISEPETIELLELKAAVATAMDTLTLRESAVLRLRFGFDGSPMTPEEISQITPSPFFGSVAVSRERIRQIEAMALRKLRHPSRTAIIKGEEICGCESEWNELTQSIHLVYMCLGCKMRKESMATTTTTTEVD